ncbi:hypothetical protein CPB85DRAFT_1249543 [Mucidula mucida]|nr:hypothetical protein CPB85DRAFT_1249543 [Mucidula mucida]
MANTPFNTTLAMKTNLFYSLHGKALDIAKESPLQFGWDGSSPRKTFSNPRGSLPERVIRRKNGEFHVDPRLFDAVDVAFVAQQDGKQTTALTHTLFTTQKILGREPNIMCNETIPILLLNLPKSYRSVVLAFQYSIYLFSKVDLAMKIRYPPYTVKKEQKTSILFPGLRKRLSGPPSATLKESFLNWILFVLAMILAGGLTKRPSA